MRAPFCLGQRHFVAQIQGPDLGRIARLAQREAQGAEPGEVAGIRQGPAVFRIEFQTRQRSQLRIGSETAADAPARAPLGQEDRVRRTDRSGADCRHATAGIGREASPIHLAHAGVETGQGALGAAPHRLQGQGFQGRYRHDGKIRAEGESLRHRHADPHPGE